MQQTSRRLLKNLIVVTTLGLAAVASWAITDYREPTIEAAAAAAPRG